jgi:hypothetical protein
MHYPSATFDTSAQQLYQLPEGISSAPQLTQHRSCKDVDAMNFDEDEEGQQ